jgi:DivIVA domain-containing protein
MVRRKVGSYGEPGEGKRVNPSEIASKEFPVVMRGYLREEVQAFLAGISDQVAARDNRIAQLDSEVARLREQVASKPAPAPAAAPAPAPLAGLDRPALLKALGEEAANILACADASAERIKAQAGITTERVRSDLRTIGSSLADVHQLLGELISLVQGLTEGANLLAATAVEANATTGTTTTTGTGSGEEVRTVLGEVLGLDATQANEITIPDEQPVEN